jgi:hypothetical protein
MSGAVLVSADNKTVIVRVPLRHRRRGGRKLMVATGQTPIRAAMIETDETILKALGRAYRWKRLLESGEFASIGDLAAAEKINHSYIRRILRLTLLSPAVTEAILDGKLPRYLQLESLLRPLPDYWAEQADLVR